MSASRFAGAISNSLSNIIDQIQVMRSLHLFDKRDYLKYGCYHIAIRTFFSDNRLLLITTSCLHFLFL